MNRKNFTQILVAVCLIAGGAALIGIHFFGVNLHGWWTLPFVAAAIALMVRYGPRFWNCLLLGASLLTLARAQGFLVETRAQYWGAMGALALMTLGVTILVRHLRPKKKPKPPWPPPPPPKSPYDYQATVTVEANVNSQENKNENAS